MFSSSPDEVIVHPVERCEQCQADLRHIRGYLSTLRKQGFDLLASLEATLSGHPILPSFQSI